MKKFLILPLLIALCSCSSNTSSSTTSNENSSFTSSETSSASSSSSSNSSSSTFTKTFVELTAKDVEFEETEDQSGYLVKKYSGVKHSYITLPSTYNNKPVVGIVDKAFFSSEFKEVNIPDSYIEFTTYAFYGCTTIQNYLVSDNHPLYKSIDGVLYSKDEIELFAYPGGRRDTYEIKEGTKKILSYSFMNANLYNVVLPESIEEIQEFAFYSAKRLKSVNIPSKVKEIKESTFDTCNDLKEIKFSEGLEKIGYRAFWQCNSLPTLNFPSTLKEIGESAFEGMKNIEHLVLSEGLETIGDFAFAYAEYIEQITFPSTLKRIGKYAFMQNYVLKELNFVEGLEVLEEGDLYYYEKLETVHIPSTLKEIGFDCFTSSVTKFKSIIVDEDDPTYTIKDGILYTKDEKELVWCPSLNTFENNTYRIPDGVEKIRDHAFYNCSNLRKVILPASLKEIGRTPFYVCNLNSIEYLGTMEEFQNNVTSIVWEYNTGESGSTILKIKWYYLNYDNGLAITSLTCSDGVLDLTTL